MTKAYETVGYEQKGDHVAVVTLERPDALNAFNGALRADLLDAMCIASANRDIRAVVLTGAGRAFCAGADIKDINTDRNVEEVLNAEYGSFLTVIRTMEKPVIAAINGPAAGIGMTLALSCDLRVMSEDAYLMSAFANIGLVPDGGLSWLLTQQIGYARAYEFAVEARKIPAHEALNLGLVNRAEAAADVLANALAWADELSRRAPLSLGLTKRAFRAAAEAGVGNAAAYEAMLQRVAIASEDCREGVAAVLGKRPASFKGR
ncbi:MAG: enoyl-CoA hydratase/isomerase family protein [Alphaproteobacteria bacterium]|nr:enoyl-CoA hydratase/isomerase family protein [Alphaproteobacteria bacterium]